MLDGNKPCGIHRGAMFTLGKNDEAAALALPGAGPMAFTGRPMREFVGVSDEAPGDDTSRAEWIRLAPGHVRCLPARVP